MDLIWRDTAGNTTSNNGHDATIVGPSSVTLIADIILRVESGAPAVSAVGVSVVIDEDFQNELNFVSAQENTGPPLSLTGFSPVVVGTTILESPLGGPGLLERFDQANLSGSAAGGTTLTLGSITFSTNPGNIVGEGQTSPGDVRVLVQLNGIDGIVDSVGNRCIGVLPRNDCPYDFGELRVHAPEPTTSALLITGLGIGLFYSRRR